MPNDNGLPSGLTFFDLASRYRNARANTPRQQQALISRIERELARSSGQNIGTIQRNNVGQRVLNERRRLFGN